MKRKADQIRLVKCMQDTEWNFAKKLRNKYFFEPLAIKAIRKCRSMTPVVSHQVFMILQWVKCYESNDKLEKIE